MNFSTSCQNMYQLWQISLLQFFLSSFHRIIPSAFSLCVYHLKHKKQNYFCSSYFSICLLFFFSGENSLKSLSILPVFYLSPHIVSRSHCNQDNPTPNCYQASSDIHMAKFSCQISVLIFSIWLTWCLSLWNTFWHGFQHTKLHSLVMSLSLMALNMIRTLMTLTLISPP